MLFKLVRRQIEYQKITAMDLQSIGSLRNRRHRFSGFFRTLFNSP